MSKSIRMSVTGMFIDDERTRIHSFVEKYARIFVDDYLTENENRTRREQVTTSVCDERLIIKFGSYSQVLVLDTDTLGTSTTIYTHTRYQQLFVGTVIIVACLIDTYNAYIDGENMPADVKKALREIATRIAKFMFRHERENLCALLRTGIAEAIDYAEDGIWR